MHNVDDRPYFQQRAQRERALAGSCSDRGVALTHTKMAEEYERRAAGHIDTINVTAVRAS